MNALGRRAPFARKAWTAMSRAFTEYPHNYCVLYTSPVHTGPSNLLYATPTGYKATMVGIPYDDLTSWRGPFPAETLVAQFEKIAAGWQRGLVDLHSAVELSPADRRAANETEWRLARAAQLHFQSVANQARFIMLRDRLADARHPLAAADRRRQIQEMRRLVTSEMALARELFTLARRDSRIGFEASNHYFYLPLDLVRRSSTAGGFCSIRRRWANCPLRSDLLLNRERYQERSDLSRQRPPACRPRLRPTLLQPRVKLVRA